ncbi:MAG: hypothetical protein L3J39_06520 [Verrucomicrobiales bacterium]|nr:hypothetical protein [Verrucomicrobiales bacterium]
MKSKGLFHRDSSKRLTLELFDIEANQYKWLCRAIVAQFDLEVASGIISNGVDVVFRDYKKGAQVVGLEWDNWSGYIIVAKNNDSEFLVRDIGGWLLEEGICESMEGEDYFAC